MKATESMSGGKIRALFGFMANPLLDLPATAMAALAVAYLWVIHDHIWRMRRLDFAPSDVRWGTLRLLIAIPMGYAFAAIVAKSVKRDVTGDGRQLRTRAVNGSLQEA